MSHLNCDCFRCARSKRVGDRITAVAATVLAGIVVAIVLTACSTGRPDPDLSRAQEDLALRSIELVAQQLLIEHQGEIDLAVVDAFEVALEQFKLGEDLELAVALLDSAHSGYIEWLEHQDIPPERRLLLEHEASFVLAVVKSLRSERP